MRSSPTLPGQSLCSERPLFHGTCLVPKGKKSGKKKKKQPRGSADAFCFLSDLIPADTYVKLSLVGSRCCLQCQL